MKVIKGSIKFHDLEHYRIVGTGQFGLVKLVRHIRTCEVYALKIMHKNPITDNKQIEHVINERLVLESTKNPFIVDLIAAYQDSKSLYLLMVKK